MLMLTTFVYFPGVVFHCCIYKFIILSLLILVFIKYSEDLPTIVFSVIIYIICVSFIHRLCICSTGDTALINVINEGKLTTFHNQITHNEITNLFFL